MLQLRLDLAESDNTCPASCTPNSSPFYVDPPSLTWLISHCPTWLLQSQTSYSCFIIRMKNHMKRVWKKHTLPFIHSCWGFWKLNASCAHLLLAGLCLWLHLIAKDPRKHISKLRISNIFQTYFKVKNSKFFVEKEENEYWEKTSSFLHRVK